jgi:hypothetical protein
MAIACAFMHALAHQCIEVQLIQARALYLAPATTPKCVPS